MDTSVARVNPPAAAKQLLRLWDVTGDPCSARPAYVFAAWAAEKFGAAPANAPLQKALANQRFDTAGKLFGHHYAGPVETLAPDQFKSGAWVDWTRALKMAKGTINHLALTVRDLAKSEAGFYAPVLGFLGYDKVEDIPGTMTLWFNADAKFAINLWQARPPVSDRVHERFAPGFHHCAFDVDSRADVDGLHRMLRENGIKVLDPPKEYPQYAPGYYAVYFEDADGLKFEVVHMPEFPT